jgi:hypothetical protein
VHQLPFLLLIRQRGYSPVGPGGLEPPASRVSDERSDQMSYEPAEDGGHDPQPLAEPGRVQTGGRSLAASSSRADSGGPDPQPLRAHPISNRRQRPRLLHYPERRTEHSKPSTYAPVRVPDDAGALTGSSSMAESGELESHAAKRALVSSEARPLAGSLPIEGRRGIEPRHSSFAGCHQPSWVRPMSYAGRDSHPHDPSGPLASEASASAFRHQRIALILLRGPGTP